MGLWSWLFPTDADRLAKARALMADGKHKDARAHLMRCKLPEAEALYDECDVHAAKAGRVAEKKRLAGDGFHGWKVEIAIANPRRKRELEALFTQEIEKAGIDLGLPEIDQDALKDAVAKAQRKAIRTGARETGAVKLVPILNAKA